MTSDTDDLEQQLRQNLKLRRELGAEVAKAKQRRGMAYRLGWVLYWGCLVLAGMWAVVATLLAITHPSQQSSGLDLALVVFFLAVLPSLLLYGLGRVLRYVLSAE